MAGLKALAKETAIYGMSSIIGRFLNYLLVPIYTNALPVESGGYGIITNMYAITALLMVLLTYGMETGFFRFANKGVDDPMRVYSTTLLSVGATALLFLIVCLSFLHPIAGFLGYGEHPWYMGMMLIVVAMDAFQAIPFAYLRYKKRPVKFAALKLLFIFASIALNIAYFVGMKGENVGVAFAINLACTSLVMLCMWKELVVLTLNSSTSYFNYRGEPMGFQYELAEQFARSLGVKLRMETAKNTHDLVHKLLTGEGDLIAYNLPITKEFKDSVEFCGEDIITHQVLVQRNSNKVPPLQNVTELIGKEVYVKPGKYLDRLINLDKELGGGILIHKVENDSVTTEDLIMQVSNGTIDYAVCDNDLAKLNKTYYPNLNISMPISFDQRASWAVRKTSPLLAAAATQWHRENMTSPSYRASSKRYFEISKRIPHGSILSIQKGKISHYDELFKKYAKEIDWDWRLLASLAYTESNFDTTAVSWAGAKGLMQLMPRTARAMGVPAGMEQNPEESIKAAVKYIAATANSFRRIPDPDERIKFILAAYNAGIGHITDAMALAEKYGKNKYIWDNNVADYILLKSNEEYFNDPLCKNGYFRGVETFKFVKEVISRGEVYKSKIKH